MNTNSYQFVVSIFSDTSTLADGDASASTKDLAVGTGAALSHSAVGAVSLSLRVGARRLAAAQVLSVDHAVLALGLCRKERRQVTYVPVLQHK